MKSEITDVKYTPSGSAIVATFDGETMFIPIDVNNRHYAEIKRRVDDGTLTIQEADAE